MKCTCADGEPSEGTTPFLTSAIHFKVTWRTPWNVFQPKQIFLVSRIMYLLSFLCMQSQLFPRLSSLLAYTWQSVVNPIQDSYWIWQLPIWIYIVACLPASEIALAPASLSLPQFPPLSNLRLGDQKASPVAVTQSQITCRQCQDSTHLQPFSSGSWWGKSIPILSRWPCFPDHLLLPSLSVSSDFHPLVRWL